MKIKSLIYIILLAVFISTSSVAFAETRGQVEEIDIIADTLFVRPLGIVGTAVGAVGWVISLPFSVTGGNTGQVGEMFIEAPLNYTFNRPLGHFDDNY